MDVIKGLLFIFLISSSVQADVLASVSYFQHSQSEQIQGQQNQQMVLSSNSYSLQLLLGARYTVGVNYKLDLTTGDSRRRREYTAPNIGLFYGPFMFEAGPVTQSTERLNADTTPEWRDPSGYFAAITVYQSWASWALAGFQFTFLDIEYRKYFDGSIETVTQPRKVSVLSPSVRLIFLF